MIAILPRKTEDNSLSNVEVYDGEKEWTGDSSQAESLYKDQDLFVVHDIVNGMLPDWVPVDRCFDIRLAGVQTNRVDLSASSMVYPLNARMLFLAGANLLGEISHDVYALDYRLALELRQSNSLKFDANDALLHVEAAERELRSKIRSMGINNPASVSEYEQFVETRRTEIGRITRTETGKPSMSLSFLSRRPLLKPWYDWKQIERLKTFANKRPGEIGISYEIAPLSGRLITRPVIPELAWLFIEPDYHMVDLSDLIRCMEENTPSKAFIAAVSIGSVNLFSGRQVKLTKLDAWSAKNKWVEGSVWDFIKNGLMENPDCRLKAAGESALIGDKESLDKVVGSICAPCDMKTLSPDERKSMRKKPEQTGTLF